MKLAVLSHALRLVLDGGASQYVDSRLQIAHFARIYRLWARLPGVRKRVPGLLARGLEVRALWVRGRGSPGEPPGCCGEAPLGRAESKLSHTLRALMWPLNSSSDAVPLCRITALIALTACNAFVGNPRHMKHAGFWRIIDCMPHALAMRIICQHKRAGTP